MAVNVLKCNFQNLVDCTLIFVIENTFVLECPQPLAPFEMFHATVHTF